MSEPLLEGKNLSKTFSVRGPGKDGSNYLVAVNGVSLTLKRAQTLGVVGESGSGKSTLARLLMLLEEPNAGEVYFKGHEVLGARGETLRAFRRNIQIVFQDPLNSLNPRMRIQDTLKEPFVIHGVRPEDGIDQEIKRLLDDVGLETALARRYPHEISGGQRQRVAIARAIALKPQVVVLDEAVSSLDVLIQAQILNLLLKLQKEHGFSYLFISHDLRVVRHMSDEVLVMYQGDAVEFGPSNRVYSAPSHPYTQKLLQTT